MASWKLTTDDRGRLKAAILNHRFADAAEKIADQHAALAAKCFDKAFTKSERALMDSLPEGWLPTDTAISVQFAGKVDELNFSGGFGYPRIPCLERRDPISRRIPSHSAQGVVLALEATDRLCIAYAQYRQALDRAIEDYKNLANQIDAVMAQANTSGQLLSLWPEIEPFLAVIDRAPKALVPAVPIGALNKMLGLPVEVQS